MNETLESALEQKREAINEAASEPVPDLDVMTWRAGLAAGAGTALLGAIEAVLKLADEWAAKAAEIGGQADIAEGATLAFKMIGHMNHRDHAAKVREAITQALSGNPGAQEAQRGEGAEDG